MVGSFKLPLTPELEQLRRAAPGARRRADVTSPPEKVIAPRALESKPVTKPQSVAKSKPAEPGAGTDPWTAINGMPVKVWNAEQCAAADAGASWEEVDAMVTAPVYPRRMYPAVFS